MTTQELIDKVGFAEAAWLLHDKYGALPSDFPLGTFKDWWNAYSPKPAKYEQLTACKVIEFASNFNEWMQIYKRFSGTNKRMAFKRLSQFADLPFSRWEAIYYEEYQEDELKRLAFSKMSEFTDLEFGHWRTLYERDYHDNDLRRLAVTRMSQFGDMTFDQWNDVSKHVLPYMYELRELVSVKMKAFI